MAITQYSINGVNMGSRSSNPMGWAILRGGTQQLGGITRSVSKVNVPGYDGYFQVPSTRTEQVLIFNIETPRENLDSLLAVLAHTGYDSNFPTLGSIEVSTSAGTAAYYDLLSAIPGSDDSNDRTVSVTATLNIPYGGWRDKSTTESSHNINLAPTVITSLASGLSLPIRDMDVFIEGNVGTMQINDSGGSWLRTTSSYVYQSGRGIMFQGSTGRAFSATNNSPWSSLGDLSHAVDISGGGFKLTPKFNPATLGTRSASISVLSLSLSGVTVKFRLRRAYSVR